MPLTEDDPNYHTVAERIASWELAGEARYLAIERMCAGGYEGSDNWRDRAASKWRWRPSPSDAYHLIGGLHPTLFKTLRNARRQMGNRVGEALKRDDPSREKPPGVIFRLDLSLLPVIDPDEVFEGADLSEEQFAERQSTLWADRAKALRVRALATGK